MWLVLCGAVLVASLGCGDDGSPATDAALSADAFDGPVVPWLADGRPPVAPPDLLPCPAGWREVDDGTGVVVCDPYPEAGYDDSCPAGQAHFPGEPGCAPVGAACPASGSFADGLPTDVPMVYVLPGATGGDGSLATPWGRLGEFSIGGLSRGTVVALGAGVHDFALRVPNGLTFWGACAASTQLTAPPMPLEAVVSSGAVGGVVRGMSVGPSDRIGVFVEPDGDLTLEGVELRDNLGLALGAFGGTLTASRVAIVGTRPQPTLDFGRGVSVRDGSDVTFDGAVLDGNSDVAVLAVEGSRVDLRAVTIRETDGRRVDGSQGRSLSVEGAHASVVESMLGRSRQTSIVVALPGSTLDVDRVVLDGGPSSGMPWGRGIGAQSGAVASIRRVSMVGLREAALLVGLDGAASDVADVVVRDTRAHADGTQGRGLVVQAGGVVVAERVGFERSTETGVSVLMAGGLDARDLLISGTRSRPSDGRYGYAFGAATGSTTTLERAVLRSQRGSGAIAANSGTTIDLLDVAILDTMPQECAATTCPDTPRGTGLVVFDQAVGMARRFVVRGAPLCGAQLARDADLTLADGVVAECAIGACVQVEGFDLSKLSERVRYEDNGTNLDITDLPVPDLPTDV